MRYVGSNCKRHDAVFGSSNLICSDRLPLLGSIGSKDDEACKQQQNRKNWHPHF